MPGGVRAFHRIFRNAVRTEPDSTPEIWRGKEEPEKIKKGETSISHAGHPAHSRGHAATGCCGLPGGDDIIDAEEHDGCLSSA